jgi:uncharacterized membrane protein YphA (DoxX/SURF4 family)
MLQWLRTHLVPHRMWAISLILLALRITLGVGLMLPGKAKLYTLMAKCAEDPLPDCEKDDPAANCTEMRAAECKTQNEKKLKFFDGLTLFGHKGWKLPGGGKLNFALAGAQEAGAGLAILLGVGARIASLPAIAVMSVAMATAHWGTFNGDFEFTQQTAFLYLLLALVLAAFGPGALSIDGLWTRGGGSAGKAPKPAKPKK